MKLRISARNVLPGKVVKVTRGATTAHVKIDLGGGRVVTAAITNEAVAELRLRTRRSRLRGDQGLRRDDREGVMPRSSRSRADCSGVVALILAALLGAGLAGGDGPAAEAADKRVVTDSAGRRVEVPARVERVFAAGGPASVIVYALAPDKLVGWNRVPTAEERAFLPSAAAALPALGRLTGRGNTANVEVVLAARPDVIVDYGSLGATYVSLADQVQKQTGVPYLLYDGSLAAIPAVSAALGDLLGVPGRRAISRATPSGRSRRSIGGWRGCRRSGVPASTTRAAPGGSRRRRRAPSMSRASTAWVRGTWQARSRGGRVSARSPWSR